MGQLDWTRKDLVGQLTLCAWDIMCYQTTA